MLVKSTRIVSREFYLKKRDCIGLTSDMVSWGCCENICSAKHVFMLFTNQPIV